METDPPPADSTSSSKGELNHGSEQTCYPTQLTLLKIRFLKIKHTSKMPLLLASLHPLHLALPLASDLSLYHLPSCHSSLEAMFFPFPNDPSWFYNRAIPLLASFCSGHWPVDSSPSNVCSSVTFSRKPITALLQRCTFRVVFLSLSICHWDADPVHLSLRFFIVFSK